MKPLDTFKQEQWDAVETAIGRHSVLMFDIETARETVTCLVWGSKDGRLFQAMASNSYSSSLAELLLDHCTVVDSSKLSPGRVAIVDASFQPVSNFEIMAIAPPEIGLFGHLSEDLRSRMHLVVPAFRSEFKDGMSASEFRHQIGRKDGWRVSAYRWDRVEKTSPSWD